MAALDASLAGAAATAALQSGERGTILVYRDRIVPRSEVHFLRRLYLGFEHLTPVWIGCRTGDGIKDLGVQPLILGRTGPWGGIERALFKQLGIVPATPDLAALRPRIVHAHFGRGGALALPIARALKIPLVVTFHGGDATKDTHYRPRLVPTIYQRRLASLQREAAMFICVSDYIRSRLIERGFPAAKLHVIRYGVEIGSPSPSIEPTASPYVLFVGRFVEKKGVSHLIEAIRILRGRGKELGLVLIGDGPMAAELKAQAAGLADAQFLGWQANDAVRRAMRRAIALSVPSVDAESGDAEGLPNVVLEAMSEGTPVIGSRHAGIGEAVDHGVTGLLVPPGDPEAIAASLQQLLEVPAARSAMGEAARRAAAQRFDAAAQSRLLELTLLSAIGKPTA